jgi:HEAT repeat protein
VGLRRTTAAPQAEAGQPAAEELLSMLDDADPERRREAALGLGQEPAALRELLEVAGPLAVHLASDDAGLRTAVAEALATMPESVPALVPGLLADPDHDVRVMTAMVLADLQHPASQTWLAEMIRGDDHPNVVAAAIDALLPSLTEEHADLLRDAVERFPDDPFLRFTVEAALR